MQAIKAALAVKLKEEMGVDNMCRREEEIVATMFRGMKAIPGLTILADNIDRRLGIISFYFDKIHYNLIVRLLNDRFGIQVRGGCSCAGTYGHYLLHVDRYQSKRITDKIDEGDLSAKPGWVRLSLHPTTTDEELEYMLDALRQVGANADQWATEYSYDPHTNEFQYKGTNGRLQQMVEQWFTLA